MTVGESDRTDARRIEVGQIGESTVDDSVKTFRGEISTHGVQHLGEDVSAPVAERAAEGDLPLAAHQAQIGLGQFLGGTGSTPTANGLGWC